MLKRLALSFISAILLLFSAGPVLAQNFGLDVSAQKAQYSSTDIYATTSAAISILLSVAGLVFLVIMFYAGLRWMTARGNEEFVSKAKDAMFAAIIGFILVTVSYGLSTFIFSKLIK